jgi:WD40 repeat protein
MLRCRCFILLCVAAARLTSTVHGQTLTLLEGHEASVRAVRYSPDGKTLITADESGAIIAWDRTPPPQGAPANTPATWTKIRTIREHSAAVLDLAVTPDGLGFFSAGLDRSIKRHDLPMRSFLALGQGLSNDPTCVAASADGTLVVTGDKANLVRLWGGALNQPTLGQVRDFGGVTAAVTAVALSPDGKHVLAASADGSLRGWQTDNAQPVGTIFTPPVNSLVVGPKGDLIATGGSDGVLRLHRWPPRPPVVAASHGGAVTAVAVYGFGDVAVSGSADQTVRLIDTLAGKEVRSLPGQSGVVTAVDLYILPPPPPPPPPKEGEVVIQEPPQRFVDEARVIAASNTGLIQWWYYSDGRPPITLAGHTGAVTHASFPFPFPAWFSTGADGTIRVCGLPRLTKVLTGHTGPIGDLALSGDGKLLATVSNDNSLALWDRGEEDWNEGMAKQLWRIADQHSSGVRSVAFSVKADQIATGDPAGTVRVFDAKEGKLLAQFVAHTGGAPRIAYHPKDGRLLTVGADGKLKLWQPSTEKVGDKAEHRWTMQTEIAAHTGKANDVAVSPDGATIATAGDDNLVKLWDAQGKPIRQLAGSGSPVARVAISGDGKLVAAGGDPLLTAKDLLLWKLADGALVSKTTLPAAVTAIGFAQDSQSVAVAAGDNHVRLYRTSDSLLLEDVASAAPVARLALVAGRSLILACADNQIRVHTRVLERVIAGHQGAVTGLVQVDEKHVLTGGADKTVRLWEIETGKEVRQFAGCTAGVLRVGVSHGDRRVVAAVAEDRVVRLWNLADAKPVATINSPTPVRALRLEGSRLYLGGDDNLVRVLDVALDPAAPVELERFLGHTGAVLALDTNGNRIISGAADNTARLWDISVTAAAKAHTGPIQALAFSADGGHLFTTGEDKTVQDWAVGPFPNELKLSLKFTGQTGVVRALAVSGDGAFLAGAGDDQHVRLWSTKDGQQLAAIATPAKLTSLAFSRDGRKLIVAGADNIVRNYGVRVKDGKYELAPIQEGHGHTAAVAALSLSADGQWLYSVGADRTVRRWLAAADAPRWSSNGHAGPIYSLAVGKGGTMVASGSGDKTVRLWDARDGRALATINGHEKAVYGVAFSHDGTRVASCGADKTVRMWDLSGREGLRLAGGIDDVLTSLAFSPNGQWLTAASQSAQWHTWDLAAPGGPQKPARSGTGHAHAISRVVYNGASQRYATLDYSGNLFLWNAPDGAMIYHQQLPSTVGYAIAYSPDGQQIAAATRNRKVAILAVPPPVQ